MLQITKGGLDGGTEVVGAQHQESETRFGELVKRDFSREVVVRQHEGVKIRQHRELRRDVTLQLIVLEVDEVKSGREGEVRWDGAVETVVVETELLQRTDVAHLVRNVPLQIWVVLEDKIFQLREMANFLGDGTIQSFIVCGFKNGREQVGLELACARTKFR